ncbi:MAG TPA: glycosyltransferase family 1 protein [Kiritimatiellia bacterium]|nr:glycosyltransferase family 1 protein [Kiritimatiellia bacterium]
MTRPLHVVIDARWIFPEISGIGLYTQELIAALVRQPGPHRYTILFHRDEVMARTAGQTHFTMNPAFSAELIDHGPFAPKDQWILPWRLHRWKPDVFHAPNYMMPLFLPAPIKRIVTIHDLIPLLFRDYAPRSRKNRLFPIFRRLMHGVAERSDRIIAVSDSTRRDIETHLLAARGSTDKIRVVPEGVRAVYQPGTRPGRKELEFLYVGRRDPYKNLPLLVEALAEVRRQGHAARLRVVGGEDERYPEARQRASTLNVNAHITWSGYVPDRDLVIAYQEADAFVLPSNYEGFGLPVLEAMACGTPVICSNTSSLPEVAGDAALYIDPARLDTLVEAMIRLLSEPELREDLRRRGLARAALFSWDETARLTRAVYEDVCA